MSDQKPPLDRDPMHGDPHDRSGATRQPSSDAGAAQSASAHTDVPGTHSDVPTIHSDLKTPHTDANTGFHTDVRSIHSDATVVPHGDTATPHADEQLSSGTDETKTP